ncbi:hypothetical protein GCM10010193_32940 [Kitasatospora atroaurantiaca]
MWKPTFSQAFTPEVAPERRTPSRGGTCLYALTFRHDTASTFTGLRQGADRDDHGRGFGLGGGGHRDGRGAEPVEAHGGRCRDHQVEQQDDERLCGSVAVEVDRVSEQDVGVVGW